MRQQRLFSTLLTVGLLGSFVLGLGFPEVLAAVNGVRLAQGGLPESYGMIRVPGGGHGSLEPLSAYYRVLGYLKDKYAGELDTDSKLTFAAIRGMLRPLDDPYTRFLDPDLYQEMREKNTGEFVGIGAQLEPDLSKDGYVRVHKPLEGTPAMRAGVKPYDVILKVDGVSTKNMEVDKVVRMIRGREGTPVRLTLRRRTPARTFEVKIVRQHVELPIVESEMLEGKVGLIQLLEFNELSDIKVDRALTQLEAQGMRGLVLDLRGNPGGTLDAAQEVASRFLPRGKTVVHIVEKDGDPEIRKVLEQKHNHRFNQPGHMIPLVVLVNRTSASASEIVSGAIKDLHTGVIMGTQTYGKGLVQTVVPLRGGSAIAITTAKYLTPNGNDINRGKDRRGGIVPDMVVEATEDDWIKQNDVQLKKALEYLHQRIGYKSPSAASVTKVSRSTNPTPQRRTKTR
jgi:carboxyl-terminal processing protease